MKQILQNLRNGTTSVTDIPAPQSRRGHLTIRTRETLVSVGTEKMLVDFGKGNLLQKAMQQPDKVRQVVDKIKTDGLVATLDRVRNKLDTPVALGYCNVGVVTEVGADAGDFRVGDRVLSNGKHAEYVVVPKNLCARIPDNVDDETASFTVLGAIALQGIRLLAPTLGETVVVTGLGLIGLMAVQLLRANGCRVIALDFDAQRRDLARSFGAEIIDIGAGTDPVSAAIALTANLGVDAVLITASTPSNEPVSQAARMCRKRGRIVLVGVVGLELSRADFYEKELTFQVSCSYGPGRYDPSYEEQGIDYPPAYVRWTEARNFSAVLALMSEGLVQVAPLVSHRFAIEAADQAYELISRSSALGILLKYPRWQTAEIAERTIYLPEHQDKTAKPAGKVCLGFLGAGNYAAGVLVPEFAKTSAKLQIIAAPNGVSSAHLGRKFGFSCVTSDNQQVFDEPQVNAVVIATRHDTHAQLVIEAMKAGKHVFVEKPLAISTVQLETLESFLAQRNAPKPLLMMGFNRRYSPHIEKIRSLLTTRPDPCAMVITVNAGAVESSHWTQDRAVGGGRIIGEACHFIDLARYLAGSPITEVKAIYMNALAKDSAVITLGFSNGSVASINYLSNGSKQFPKERLEVFSAGGILQMDNFKKTHGFNWPGFKRLSTFRQDKGQSACVAAFVQAVEKQDLSRLIPLAEILEVTRVCLDIETQLA